MFSLFLFFFFFFFFFFEKTPLQHGQKQTAWVKSCNSINAHVLTSIIRTTNYSTSAFVWLHRTLPPGSNFNHSPSHRNSLLEPPRLLSSKRSFLLAQQQRAPSEGAPPQAPMDCHHDRCSEKSKPTAVWGTFRFQRCALVGPPAKPASPSRERTQSWGLTVRTRIVSLALIAALCCLLLLLLPRPQPRLQRAYLRAAMHESNF